MPADQAILQVDHLKMYFPVMHGVVLKRHVGDVRAVDDVSFEVRRGETLGLVGESGCGKTTTGRAILQMYRPTAGKVLFRGEDLCQLAGERLRLTYRRLQMIFQDPYSSLNPRARVESILAEPFVIHNALAGDGRRERIRELLEMVGLDPSYAHRFPHEFSGGQRQRIGIARALALEPELVVCDEPISSLDVSIQAQIINLLKDLQQRLSLTYLFIAHDLAVVRHISDRVAVMYLGTIVEIATRAEIYGHPLHPYTRALLAAVSVPEPRLERERARSRVYLKGEPESPRHPPSGCRFHTRCPIARDICAQQAPDLKAVSGDHSVACHFAGEG